MRILLNENENEYKKHLANSLHKLLVCIHIENGKVAFTLRDTFVLSPDKKLILPIRLANINNKINIHKLSLYVVHIHCHLHGSTTTN